VLVLVAMADAQSANQDSYAALEELCLDAACMNDADVLETSHVTCLNLAQKICERGSLTGHKS